MNQIYFENVPSIMSLSLEQVLFSFENVPIVFVCLDGNNNRYLCICDDIIDEESWLITQVSDIKLLEILNDEVTVLSAFRNKTVILANRNAGENIQYRVKKYEEIDVNELPVSDQYLEMKEQLADYIKKLSEDIVLINLDLSFLGDTLENVQYSFRLNLCTDDVEKKTENLSITNTIENYSISDLTIQVNYNNIQYTKMNEFDNNYIDLSIAKAS